MNLGVILLEQIIPGSSAITPIAGTLVARAYSRSEEVEADQHAVEILQRAGYSKDVMIDALAWVMQSSPPDGGGFSCQLIRQPKIELQPYANKMLSAKTSSSCRFFSQSIMRFTHKACPVH